jgi:hypothetical protein
VKQSRFMSLLETFLSTAAGFFLSLFVQWLVLPVLLGVNIPIEMNLAFAAIMTVVSLLRQFVMRRVFEALHIRRPLSPFMQAVIAERFRQIEGEGWSLEHDDAHLAHELARAGAAYVLHAGIANISSPPEWPWPGQWWKPAGYRRDMVRGVALQIAEGEKFDRFRKRKPVSIA